jgi:hypothetical protein
MITVPYRNHWNNSFLESNMPCYVGCRRNGLGKLMIFKQYLYHDTGCAAYVFG